jgi:hypothetical protein
VKGLTRTRAQGQAVPGRAAGRAAMLTFGKGKGQTGRGGGGLHSERGRHAFGVSNDRFSIAFIEFAAGLAELRVARVVRRSKAESRRVVRRSIIPSRSFRDKLGAVTVASGKSIGIRG